MTNQARQNSRGANFNPRTAIVTASDSGIGKATAIALARAGMDVGITWHTDEAGAQGTAEEVRKVGRKAVVARLDTTDLPGCGDVIDRLADELGGVELMEQARAGYLKLLAEEKKILRDMVSGIGMETIWERPSPR